MSTAIMVESKRKNARQRRLGEEAVLDLRQQEPGVPAVLGPEEAGVQQINRLIMGYRGAKALLVAVSLDLFTRIGDGWCTTEDLCRSLKITRRPTGILLDALTALGFLIKQRSQYKNSPLAAARLVRGRPDYLGDILQYHEMAWQSWSGLGSMMRSGKPAFLGRDLLASSPKFAKALILGMDNIASGPAQEIARRLEIGSARRLLDVGAGPGAYTRALLQRHPQLTAVLLDLPNSLAVAKEVFARSPLRERVAFKAGDYHTVSFGVGAFDVVLLSHVTHHEDEGASQRLIRKCHTALRPGGILVIHDFTVQQDGAGPLHAALLSLHMLVASGRGRIYSRAEYEGWMASAGFSRLAAWEVPSELQNPTWVITGIKG